MTTPVAADEKALGSGFYPWAAWSLSGLFYSYIFFVRVAPSVMTSELMSDFAVNAAVLGNLSAVYFYAYAGLQIPVGMLHDRFGPRRVLTGAALLCAAGGLMFATAEALWVAYVGRALVGAGSGFALVGTFKVASMWHPPRRFAMLIGLAIAFGTAGAIGAQAPLAAAVALAGWRGTMIAAAAFGCALAALIWLVVGDGADGHAHAGTPRISAWRSLKGVTSNPQTWFLALICGATGAPILAFAALWGVPYLVEAYGVTRPTAAFTTSLALVGFGVGGPIFGWFSDRAGRRKPQLIVACCAMLATFAAVVYVPGLALWAIQALLFTLGLAVGACMVCYAAAREHNRAGAVGITTSMINIMGTVFGGALQPVIGWILDLHWDGRMEGGARIYSVAAYQVGFLTIVAVCAGAIVMALLVRETYCRQVSRAD